MSDDDITKNGDNVDSFMKEQIERHQERMTRAINDLENRMVVLYGRIETDDSGVIKGPKHTLKQVQQIHSRLALEFEKTYGKAVTDMADGLGEIESFVNENLSYLDVKGELPQTDRVLLEALWEREFDRFNNLASMVKQDLSNGLYSAIVGGIRHRDLVSQMRAKLIEYEDKYNIRDAKGRSMSMYAGLFVHDGMMNYYRSVTMAKAAQAKIKHFLFYGNVMNTSRAWCIARVGMTFSEEEIKSWDDDDWKGKSGPPLQYCGGYNCRHHWMPVKPQWAPKGIKVKHGELPEKLLNEVIKEREKLNRPVDHLKKTRENRAGQTGEAGSILKSLSNLNLPLDGSESLLKRVLRLVLQLAQEALDKADLEKSEYTPEDLDKIRALKEKVQSVEKQQSSDAEATPKTQKTAASKEPEGPKKPSKQAEPGQTNKAKDKKPKTTKPKQDESGKSKKAADKGPVTVARKDPDTSLTIPQPKKTKKGEAAQPKKAADKKPKTTKTVVSKGAKKPSKQEDPVTVARRDPDTSLAIPKETKSKQAESRQSNKSKDKKTKTTKSKKAESGQPKKAADKKPVKTAAERLNKAVDKIGDKDLLDWQKMLQADLPPKTRKNIESLHNAVILEHSKSIDSLSEKERQAIRRKYVEGMVKRAGVDVGKINMDEIEQGFKQFPTKLILDLDRNGLKIYVSDEVKRSSFLPHKQVVRLTKDYKYTIVAHETAHALDSLWAGGGKGFSGRLGYWEDNLHVTSKEGDQYREWFRKRLTGEKGKYENGDGYFWKDNWISDYEGRIYERQEKTEAVEWISKQSERYAKYYRATEEFDRQAEELYYKFPNGMPLEAATHVVFREYIRGNISYEEARDKIAAKYSGWSEVRSRYPEFARWNEEKYEKPRPGKRPFRAT